MSNAGIVEDRLAVLEREVADLKRRMAPQGQPQNWLENVAGSMQDEPEFEKVLELGRVARRQETSPADDRS
jgi:hypothetical protein